MVTNLQTGRAEYREVPRRDASFLLLQATCAMPVLFQPIRLDDGAPYLDGAAPTPFPGSGRWRWAATGWWLS